MLRTLSSGKACAAAGAGRLTTVASVMTRFTTSCRHHPRKRVIQYSRGACDQPRRRAVLDPRLRGDDDGALGSPGGDPGNYQPSHSGLRGRSIVFTFSILMPPFLTRSLRGASVAPATFMR